MAGDFNVHRPDWEEMTTEPIEAAKSMTEWLQDASFLLLNVHNCPAFHHHNHVHHSVCDLIVANARAIGRLLVSRWRVNEEARTYSYHAMMRYTIANKRVATGELVGERPCWKKANAGSHNEALRATFNEVKDNMSSVANQEQHAREAILDCVADAIREAHHEVTTRTVPATRMCQLSVPYWDE